MRGACQKWRGDKECEVVSSKAFTVFISLKKQKALYFVLLFFYGKPRKDSYEPFTDEN